MASPAIEDRTIYLDRYTTSAGWSLDLAGLMCPADSTQPSAMAITAGNSAGHFTNTSGVLTVSATGDSADLSSGTYSLTIQGTWSAYGSATNTATLTIICPPASVYVDPAGSDAAAGTKAAPWAHSPDDPLATGVAAAYTNPGSVTLCVHKDGSLIRSRLVCTRANLINAGSCGWGASTPATYCGADATPTATTPSSGEVFANPNFATLKKFSFVAAQTPAQNLIDREAVTLLMWAQWPACGTDPYLDAYDPARQITGGMYQMAATNVVSAGASSTLTLPAAGITEFGSKDLTGCLIGLWVTSNFVNWYTITAYNTTTHAATFDLGGSTVQQDAAGNTAFQIVGHPFSIKAAGQYGWASDLKTLYGWFTTGTAPEILTRKVGCDLSALSAPIVYGLNFEGYHGATDKEAVGVGVDRSSNFTLTCLRTSSRWLSSYGGIGGGIRCNGGGNITGGLWQGNTIYDCVRAAGMRVGNTTMDSVTVSSNIVRRTSVTGIFLNSCTNCIIERNTLENILGVHSNGLSIYENAPHYPSGNTVRRNTFRNVCRPMTFDTQVNLTIADNVVEMDGTIRDGVRIFGSPASLSVTHNVFARRRNVAGTGDDALSAGGLGNYGTYSGNIIDGLLGGKDATFTTNLVTQHATNENDIVANVAPDSGNVYEARLWDGTLSPRWKQWLGAGAVGREMYVYGIAVVSFTSVINQDVSTVVANGWSLLSSDGTRPISVTNGEYNIANDAAGTGAVGWSSSASTVANGKYINVRTTTTSTYETDKTVTLDLGDGNVFTWTARTKQAAGYPLVVTDTGDNWRPTTAMALGASSGKVFTFAFFGRLDDMTITETFFGHFAGGASVAVNIEVLSTDKLRITLKNSVPTQFAEFQTPALTSYFGQLITMLITVDTAQSTVGAGVKVYVNGSSAGTSTLAGGSWTQDGLINFPLSTASVMVGNNLGLFGMFWFAPVLLDITDATVRDKFTALRIGTDGSNVTGTAPPVFLVGTAASSGNNWNDTNGINRGTGQKFKPQGATAVTLDNGGASAWPSYTYATALTSLTGSSTPVMGQTRTYTVTVNGALLNPITIALSDGGSGTFTPSSLTANPLTGPQDLTFTYQPASAGAKTITASSSGLTSATLGVTAQPAVATSYTLTGASSATVGDAITLTMTLNGSNASGVSISLALSGVTGTFSFNPQVVSAGLTTATVVFTPTSAGTAVITPTNTEGLTDPAAKSITVAAAAGGGAVSPTRLRLGVSVGL